MENWVQEKHQWQDLKDRVQKDVAAGEVFQGTFIDFLIDHHAHLCGFFVDIFFFFFFLAFILFFTALRLNKGLIQSKLLGFQDKSCSILLVIIYLLDDLLLSLRSFLNKLLHYHLANDAEYWKHIGGPQYPDLLFDWGVNHLLFFIRMVVPQQQLD